MPQDETVSNVESEAEGERVECVSCDALFNLDEATGTDNGSVCQSCYEDHYATCADCDSVVHTDDTHSVDGGERTICGRCRSRNYSRCDDCCGLFADDYFRSVRGGSVCVRCLEGYAYCDGCDEYVSEDDYYGDGLCQSCHDSDAEEEEEDCDCDCSDCRSTGAIHSYHSRSAQNALKSLGMLGMPKDKTRFGVELEAERRDSGDREDSARQAIAAIGSDFAIAEHDGSLSNGFEIVTAPATLDIHRDHWARLFDAYEDGLRRPLSSPHKALAACRSWQSGHCGMHVHFSRAGITSLGLGKLLVFLNAPANRSFTWLVAGRNDTIHTKVSDKKITDARRPDWSRYSAVNTTNDKTIEIRIFRGTLKRASFFKNLEFVASLVRFVRHTGIQQLAVSDYLAWIAPQSKDYPNLVAFLRDKNQLPSRALPTTDHVALPEDGEE